MVFGAKRTESPSLEKEGAAKKLKQQTPLPSFPIGHTYAGECRGDWEREFASISCALREKTNWQEKVFREDILKKWEEELRSANLSVFKKRLFQELQWQAKRRENGLTPTSVDYVWKVEKDYVPESLRGDIVKAADKLLQTKRTYDWHPGSNETVLDIVHPSLYCYVEGETPCLAAKNYSHMSSLREWDKFIGTGSATEQNDLDVRYTLMEKFFKIAPKGSQKIEEGSEPPKTPQEIKDKVGILEGGIEMVEEPWDTDDTLESVNAAFLSLTKSLHSTFQWLPCDVSVSDEGKVKVLSYINNVHPFHENFFYPIVENMLELIVPLWSKVLSDLVSATPFSSFRPTALDDTESVYLYSLQEQEKEEEVEDVVPLFDESQVNVKEVNLNGRQLQVIVKLAKIMLTPEKPSYVGSWHIEGVPREHIVSTAIYYYSQDNVVSCTSTETDEDEEEVEKFLSAVSADSTTKNADDGTHLQFREGMRDPEETDMQCPMGYGFEDTMNRDLGRVKTEEGCLLAFPNTLQHCVSKMTLKDKSKPGHRDIFVFFLVDPNEEVLSTSRVPPFRRDWVSDRIVSALSPALPPELGDLVGRNSSWLPGLEEAKKHREYLMATRKLYVKEQNQMVFERAFSFCEH